MSEKYKVIGVMSGTSLDGLDIAYCEFVYRDNKWKYTIREARTIPYTEKRKQMLSGLMTASAETFCFTDAEFGRFIGLQVQRFCEKNKIKPSLISSHGHTIFHQPKKGFTTQIGSGAAIFAETKVPAVTDFRSVDVSMGGQGAPLVPVGDKLLFPDYDFCLNLGGISNISFDLKGQRIAYDISPVNIVLNMLAREKGREYDKNGQLASAGTVNASLLNALNRLDFYKQKFPKSLGREWIDKKVFPLINASSIRTEDKLATFCEHIAQQIAASAASVSGSGNKAARMLVTGGGAFNSHLIGRLTGHLKGRMKVVVPDKNTIMFKEALIFGFLGVLRMRNEANSLKSVTGAAQDNIGGCLYGSFNAFS